MGTENLDRIFNPSRIAVIGASDTEGSLGARLLRNLVGVGYKGAVYPVNPFRATVQGITAYPSIAKIPWKVDLAIVATPAHTVPQVVEECGKAGVGGLVIITAGFKEASEEGAALEKQILEHRKRYNMRIIGPNSFGVMRPKIKLNATFSNKSALSGKIAFISHSAALCASVLDWATESNVGFSTIVSTGSMLDVDLGDLIDYFGVDAQTRSIVLYLESISNARKFMSATRGIARIKPVVVVKAGRFPESAMATISHTGALCGEDAVHDAAFRRAGIVRVEAISDLFNCAEALSMQPNPKGSNLMIITNAGGPGIIATDTLVARGGVLSKLKEETIQALKSVLPSYCSTANPIDILEEADAERLRRVLEICFKDEGSDGFLVICTPQGVSDPLESARTIAELSEQTTKPLLTTIMGEDELCWRARKILQKKGIPAFTTPEEAVSTFIYMYNYTQNLELLYQTPEELPIELSIPTFLREVLRKTYSNGQMVLGLPDSMKFLEAYKIPTTETLVAKDSAEAENMASKLCCPVVMKALSPQITHKSRAEGVILNVWSPSEARVFFWELAEKVKKHDPQAEFQGVAIQPMIRKRGYELLLGSKKDSQFGSVIVFGMGGIATELTRDISVGFPPLNQVLAKRLAEKTAIYRYMASSGNSNLKLLEEILVKFSQMVVDFPEIKEIDINPLIVNEEGASAVDARIVIDSERILNQVQPHEHLVIAPYPQKYVTRWQMKDGTPVLIRPIKPEDEPLFQELFRSFSEETMRLRYFQIIEDVTHEALTRYCNLDYDREIALVAEVQEDKRRLVGAVSLILEPGKNCGEFAVVVGDQWQSRGLGSKLLDYIIEIGKGIGLETIYGYVISDNTKMVDLCKRKGFEFRQEEEGISRAILKFA